MATLADLPRVTQDQIARLKLRGNIADLEALKMRLPEALRGLVDEVAPAMSGWTSRRSVSRRVKTVPAEKPQPVPTPALEPEIEGVQPRPSAATPTSDTSALQQSLDDIKAQLATLQQTTGFKAVPSQTYDGLQEQVRQQLLTDNVRMEKALLDTSTYEPYERFRDELAFRRFCVYAFYQVEELLNLYYHTKYGDDIAKLRSDWYNATPRVEIDPKVKLLTQIPVGTKIFAYTSSTSEGDTMHNLRRVRNMEEHRCTTVLRKYAGDLPKLQVQYDALGLSAKRAVAKSNGKKYEMTAEERELEDRYYALQFLSERSSNIIIVRAMLNRLYVAVKSVLPTN